jgi:hypothetical protein
MSVNVSWAVQAHPKRTLLAKALAERIGGPVDIVWDPDPDGYRSPWRTYRHLLETTPAWATHRAQIQDDAIVCDGFRSAVDLAVAARPDRLLVLYVGGNPYQHAQAVREACWGGSCWADLDPAHWLPVVATVWPVSLIPPICSFVDGQGWAHTFGNDDEIVGRFVRACGVRPLATAPSLVQHPDVEPSLVGQKTRAGADAGRIAALWVGGCTECDPLTWDWESGLHDFPQTT